MIQFNVSDTFNRFLPADENPSNSRRQVMEACYSFVKPLKPSKPELIHVSDEMATAIGLNLKDTKSEAFLDIFSGTKVLDNTNPYAMCYGGHQFGQWAGQLGDGRAINLFEVLHNKQRWALQLKGAGPTPYSRSADGFAVLRSSIREHLCSEAMHHLNVPSTRSLSLMLSGDQVLRDMLYNGNAAYEKGAIVCRVAPTFIRFGNFQIFASRQDVIRLKQLADYTIQHFFPAINVEGKARYIAFFEAVLELTFKMVLNWQRVGFVHGVMNTDNMSILGLTIDYGPYGWLEGYDKNWTPNTTDRQQRRYRFGNQPGIALWNLYQLANALYPLVEDAKPFENALEKYQDEFLKAYMKMMSDKLGLKNANEKLILELENVLMSTETDMTIFFRLLSKLKMNSNKEEAFEMLEPAFYDFKQMTVQVKVGWKDWLDKYLLRLNEDNWLDEDRSRAMCALNPKYVLRNYMAQMAIDEANEGRYALIDEIYQLLKYPYDEQPENEKWFARRPEWARHKVGCSMLSCSS